MKHWYLKLNPGLSDYVRTLLIVDGFSHSESSDLPLFTNGMPALVCETRNNKDLRITLFGQSVPSKDWIIEDNVSLIAYFFKPFALGSIFKLSAQDLKEKPVILELSDTKKISELHLQLPGAKTTEAKIAILDDLILAQLRINQRECEIIKYATDQLMLNSGSDTLSKIPEELNLTERTFQRIFKKYVGISANHYRRICQSYFAFSQLKGGHFDNLTDIAYSNGYYDQSHYIRSFKEFTDKTPNEYLKSGLTPGK